MTTPAKRRTIPMKGRPSQRTDSSLERVWLYVVGGFGIGGISLILVAGFAFGLWGPEPTNRAGRTVSPVVAVAAPSTNVMSDNAPAADIPSSPNEPLVDANKYETIAAAPPAPVSQEEPRPIAAPTPEPPPAIAVTSPQRPHKFVSESDLRLQLRDVPEFGLKPTTRDALVESYKKNYQSNAAMGRKPMFDASILMKHVANVNQLHVRSFPSCQLHPTSAVTLGVLSPHTACLLGWACTQGRKRETRRSRGDCGRLCGRNGAASHRRGCGPKLCRR